MFGVNWNDPQTLWLNYTNLGLGLVVVACIGVAAYAFWVELAARWRAKPAGDVDAQVQRLVAEMSSTHAFHSPELGLTMADGGEPETQKKAKKRGK